MLLCLLTHDSSTLRTLLTPLLNGAAIAESDGEVTLTLGPFSYRLVCLYSANVSQLGAVYSAETAELCVQADFMLTDTSQGVLALYRFHESTLQVSACTPMSEDDLEGLRRGGVFVRLYPPGAGDGRLPRIALAFPLKTQVQEGAVFAQEDPPAQVGPAFVALTPGPAGCEVHYTTGEVLFARVWLPGPSARVFPPATAEPVEDPPDSGGS